MRLGAGGFEFLEVREGRPVRCEVKGGLRDGDGIWTWCSFLLDLGLLLSQNNQNTCQEQRKRGGRWLHSFLYGDVSRPAVKACQWTHGAAACSDPSKETEKQTGTMFEDPSLVGYFCQTGHTF